MRIPKQFMLTGRVWSVDHNEKLLRDNQAYGHCEYSTQTITIHEPENDNGQTRQGREHTFCHELLHAMAFTAGLELEEQQVDVMAGLFHQFMVTRQGEIE